MNFKEFLSLNEVNYLKRNHLEKDDIVNNIDGNTIRVYHGIAKLGVNVKKSRFDLFLPNDDFDINKIINLYNGDINSEDFKRYIFRLKTFDESMLSKLHLFPKQIKQVLQLRIYMIVFFYCNFIFIRKI